MPLAPSPAPASVSTPPVPASLLARTEPRWYGWQTLVPDAALMGALVAELELRPGGLPNRDVFLVAGFSLGVPVVHAAHRRWGHAAASVAGRIVLPAVGGYLNSVKNAEFDGRGAAWGMVIGMAIASILDGALSWDCPRGR